MTSETFHFVRCHCGDSAFKDQDHCHILTGSFKVVSNNKLCKMFSKNLKFRGPHKFDFKKDVKGMINGIDNGIVAWCWKKGCATAMKS